VKVKGKASPFDGNLIYWAQRTGQSPLIPYKARLIREQKGRCGICGRYFLPDDVIERDHIRPKALAVKITERMFMLYIAIVTLIKLKFKNLSNIRRNSK
jgi:5-methylcytosine-specific restriction endonuclease McrA